MQKVPIIQEKAQKYKEYEEQDAESLLNNAIVSWVLETPEVVIKDKSTTKQSQQTFWQRLVKKVTHILWL